MAGKCRVVISTVLTQNEANLRRRRQRTSIDLLHSRFIPRKGLKECEDSFSATLSSAMPWSDRNVTSLFLGWRVELETD